MLPVGNEPGGIVIRLRSQVPGNSKYPDRPCGGADFSKPPLRRNDTSACAAAFSLAVVGQFCVLYSSSDKGRSFAVWQGLHEGKEMLLPAAAEIGVPRLQCIRLKNIQSFHDLFCP